MVEGGLNLDDEALRQMINLQEKVALTFGRRRKEVAIGIFDFDRVKPPIHYRAAEKTERFVPLGFDEEMTLEEILERHEKGGSTATSSGTNPTTRSSSTARARSSRCRR